MAVSNDSAAGVVLIYQVPQNSGQTVKLVFAFLMALFFSYLNAIMFYTLWSKDTFKETPRYILFMHMLINDSFQHLSTYVLYISSLLVFKMITSLCALLSFVAATTFKNAPLNLAVMTLERYVAICFPLRHAEIATQSRTYMAVGVIWVIGSINHTIDLLFNLAVNPNFLTSVALCTRDRFILQAWQGRVLQIFNACLFGLVGLTILFTYGCILRVARSVSSKKDSAAKAQWTVLLHLGQLGLCLTSFIFSTLERAASSASSNLVSDLLYINYLFVLLLPRCLSPLIYGLRDDAVRPLLIHHFRCVRGKRQAVVNAH